MWWQDEETVEETKEFIENPDGTYTVKTTNVITTFVEEEEECEEDEEVVQENGKENGNDVGETAENGDFGELTKDEIEELLLLQAERKWLDSMGSGEAGDKAKQDEEEELEEKTQDDDTKTKKKKKRPDGEKKGKKKKKRGDGKENKVSCVWMILG